MLNTMDKVFELLNSDDNTNEEIDNRISSQNIMDMIYEDLNSETDIP